MKGPEPGSEKKWKWVQHSPATFPGPSTASVLYGAGAVKVRQVRGHGWEERAPLTLPRRAEAWPWQIPDTHLPGVGQPADGRVAEAKHDRKERVEILLLLEAVSTRPRHPQRKQPNPQ